MYSNLMHFGRYLMSFDGRYRWKHIKFDTFSDIFKIRISINISVVSRSKQLKLFRKFCLMYWLVLDIITQYFLLICNFMLLIF